MNAHAASVKRIAIGLGRALDLRLVIGRAFTGAPGGA